MKIKKILYILVLLIMVLALSGIVFERHMESEEPSAEPSVLWQSEPPEVSSPPAPEESDLIEETPEIDPVSQRALEIMSEMSDWEKLCQLFVVRPQAVTGNVTGQENIAEGLSSYPVGGFIFFSDNLWQGGESTRQTISAMQQSSKLGLIISADEEGGRVERLMSALGTTRLSAMLSYQNEPAVTAYENAAIIANDMKGFGFNTDYAPVADVFSNPSNTVIGDRAYSTDFKTAEVLIPSAVRGFLENDILCSLKHFPGHGDTYEDSHNSAATVNKTLAQLREEELLPFIAGIEAGSPMVMIGHLTVPDIDTKPATTSYKIITELLREELGFEGVVISDSLEMGAITGTKSDRLAVEAISAGMDILLCIEDLPLALTGLQEALETGELTMERIEESVFRVLSMKIQYGLIAA
ncbi:glycoside hydrolase family 3 [Clostridiaceae bacterium OttesenSCG-928-D20]|nr:glycoside hydrolase family 3 [Clostridiaceae bacterium OttesenSCG-928-D20]